MQNTTISKLDDAIILNVDFGDTSLSKIPKKIEEFKKAYGDEIKNLGKKVIILPKECSVSYLPLEKDSVIIVNADIGKMPPKKAKEWGEQVKQAFNNTFPHNELVVTMHRNGENNIKIECSR